MPKNDLRKLYPSNFKIDYIQIIWKQLFTCTYLGPQCYIIPFKIQRQFKKIYGMIFWCNNIILENGWKCNLELIGKIAAHK